MEDGLPRRCRNKFGSPAIRTDHVNRHVSQLKVTVVLEQTIRSAWWDSHAGTGHSIWKAGPAAATFMEGDASGRITPRVPPLVPKQTGVGLGGTGAYNIQCVTAARWYPELTANKTTLANARRRRLRAPGNLPRAPAADPLRRGTSCR